IKRSTSNKLEGFGPTRTDLECQRAKIRPSKAHSRSSSTAKRGCNWKAVAKALKKNDRKWTFELPDPPPSHNNHPAPTEGQGFFQKSPYEPEHKALIASYLDRPAIKNRDIAIDLQDRFPGIIF
ncbi:hypothetical protein B0T25DRAFT_438321, partial [Lasiosphaeria hispida]